ncbi:hypothetical protein PENTCL1PPCAC_24582, partial [Pristionchus entomophagus]
ANFFFSVVAHNNSGGKPNKPKHSVEDRSTLSPKQPPKGPTCVFCGLHQYSGECTKVNGQERESESKHSTNECHRKCANCSGRHHKALCEKPSSTSINAYASHQHQERLYTASAIIVNPNVNAHRASMAFIHLDHGSQATLISRELVNRLSLSPIDRREMTINGINSEATRPSLYDIVNVDIITDRGRYSIDAVVMEGTSVNSISTQPLDDNDFSVIQANIGSVPSRFSNYDVVHSDQLLSVTDTLELLENSKETKLPSGCRLLESSIGPIVVGSNKIRSHSLNPLVSVLTVHTETSFKQKIERLFSVDPSARVYETTEKESRKSTDALVNKHFDETIEKKDNDCIVQYSIKPEAKSELPTSYDLASPRLNSTIKTLSEQRSYLEYYDSIINDQLSLGQIEKVDPNDSEGIIHYLAHQPVLRPDKPTTPLRIVYDASAHLKNKPSLNDMIHPGPSDLELIPALLLRSRSRLGLVVADVEKALLQVKLHPSQRNMLRFLWVKDLDMPVSRPNILVLRFCVTPFGVNQSPSLLNKVINHHINLNSDDYDPLLIRQLVSNLYVDNTVDNQIRDSFHSFQLENFSLPIDRYSHLSDSDEITLVAFSDASQHAMATCIYSWSPHSNPTLLISKCKLAPIKAASTIPKMELDSLVMSHSLLRFTVDALRKEFPEKPIHVYTYSDSAVVLHWCKPEFSKPLGPFVNNRVKKINEIRDELSDFHHAIYHHPRHVRSEFNRADHSTRGLTAKDMNDPKYQWWIGPTWMQTCPSTWPNEDLSSL